MGLASLRSTREEAAVGFMRGKIQLTPEVLVPRLGDYLVEKGLLSHDDLLRALAYQETHKGEDASPLIGQVLIDLSLITRAELDQAVTEQIIRLRAALQDANRRLELRVQERTAELEQALKKLSAVNQLKANIVSNISHELRTPLTHIEGYLELMGNQDLGPLNEEQMRAVRVLMRSAERLERLIEDLILFSMTERGEINLRLQPIRIMDLLRSMFERMREKAAERKLSFDFICPFELPVVESDTEKISWIILQLLDNAIKFTPQGGKVVLRGESLGRSVRISVEDSGIGIPPERIPEIFEPFYQLDGSSTRKYGGTGLGLALVKKIIEAHGSKIEVASEVGKGSSFSFTLRVSQRSI